MTKSAKPIVVGIGEVLWDMLPSGKQLGGAPANFVYHAGALGAEAIMASRVGKDKSGLEIIKKLRVLGVNTGYIGVDSLHPTGIVEVKLDSKGKPAYDIKRNVAWDFMPFPSGLRSLAKRTNAVCFGSLAQRSAISRRTIREFVRAAPRSALKVFDINLRQRFYDRAVIRDSLAIANILKINDDELRLLAEMFSMPVDEAAAAGWLLEKYQLKVVAVTKGAKGASLYCPAGVYYAASRKIAVVDTVGAGDAFTAALVMGMLKGLPMEVVCRLATRLAEYVCSRHGATPKMPANIFRN
jgi:fructokinase